MRKNFKGDSVTDYISFSAHSQNILVSVFKMCGFDCPRVNIPLVVMLSS